MDVPVISIYSFGFDHGGADDANVVYDVSFLKGPADKSLDGLDEKGSVFVLEQKDAKEFINIFAPFIKESIIKLLAKERSSITIAIGSDEGKHRAPAIVHELARRLERPDWKIVEWHRDILK
ncbi:MAG: hypothetical protein NT030_02325 [Candidatus Saganbacteria bacterium]|nr:hypothetical protein [Candidatus Saganbacteria bacterium]